MEERKSGKKEVQVTALIDMELKKKLWKSLIDDEITYREWLVGRMKDYLERKEKNENV
jgi:hypothetical protein